MAPTVYRFPEPYNDIEMTFRSLVSRDAHRQQELFRMATMYLHETFNVFID